MPWRPSPPTEGSNDLQWYDQQPDRARACAQIDALVPLTPTSPDIHTSNLTAQKRLPVRSWSNTGLRAALRQIRGTPPEPIPAPSSAYAFPARAARYIKARDISCTFPGCRRLARYCQNDHIIEWPRGRTSVHNAASECTHHHQAKHACFTLTKLSNGRLRWTSPTGLTVDTAPRPLLRGW